MGCCNCTQKVEIGFSSPLKIMMVEPPDKGGSRMTVTYGVFSFTGSDIMYTLPVDKQVNMKVSYVDAAGNPAKVDGQVTWASSDDDILNVQRNEDDTTQCRVLPMGEVGQAQVTATADADLGEGVRQLICTADIEVVGGEAVAGTITPVGEPSPIPKK
jgi:hypothetical protein